MTLTLLLVLAQVQPLNLNQQAIIVKDEGATQSPVRASTINCTGAGVTCTQSGTTMQLAVSGGGGGGGVTSVTASSPLASSGGATPNVTLADVVPGSLGGFGDVQPTCGAGEFVKCDGTTCACQVPAGGGAAANAANATLTLTTAGYYSATVSASWVTANSRIVCAPFGTAADGLTVEAVAVAGLTVSVSDLTVSTSFKVHVFSPYGLAGTLRLHCVSVELPTN